MGAFEGSGDTHGICPECKEKMMADIEATKPKPSSNPPTPPVKEGRCEDWPCCGHEAGDCPDVDPETGEQSFRCSHCGRRLSPHSPSSMCASCINRFHQSMEDPTGQDMDDF